MIAIRQSNNLDREGTRKVRNAAWRSAYQGILPASLIDEATSDVEAPPGRGWRANVFIPDHILATRVSFVATNNEEVVGFVSGGHPRTSLVPADCELWAIYVHPDHQGIKIGRSLFSEFQSAMSAIGRKSMMLWTFKENTHARKFYESLGGELQSVEKMFTWNGESITPEVAYKWSLPSIS